MSASWCRILCSDALRGRRETEFQFALYAIMFGVARAVPCSGAGAVDEIVAGCRAHLEISLKLLQHKDPGGSRCSGSEGRFVVVDPHGTCRAGGAMALLCQRPITFGAFPNYRSNKFLEQSLHGRAWILSQPKRTSAIFHLAWFSAR